MRNLSCAVNVRRRGRSKNSGDAAAGAGTIVGLRPSSLSAPAAARVLLSLILGITTGCLSYAPRVNSRQVFVSSSLARREPSPRSSGAGHSSDINLFGKDDHAELLLQSTQ